MNKVLLGRCMVDSGQIMIVDPCYVENRNPEHPGFTPGDGDFQGHHGSEQYARSDEHEFSYTGACRSTLQSGGGQLGGGLAVVTGTRYGDGDYPVYAEVGDDGRVISVTILFENEYFECEECMNVVSIEGSLCEECATADDRCFECGVTLKSGEINVCATCEAIADGVVSDD